MIYIYKAGINKFNSCINVPWNAKFPPWLQSQAHSSIQMFIPSTWMQIGLLYFFQTRHTGCAAHLLWTRNFRSMLADPVLFNDWDA